MKNRPKTPEEWAAHHAMHETASKNAGTVFTRSGHHGSDVYYEVDPIRLTEIFNDLAADRQAASKKLTSIIEPLYDDERATFVSYLLYKIAEKKDFAAFDFLEPVFYREEDLTLLKRVASYSLDTFAGKGGSVTELAEWIAKRQDNDRFTRDALMSQIIIEGASDYACYKESRGKGFFRSDTDLAGFQKNLFYLIDRFAPKGFEAAASQLVREEPDSKRPNYTNEKAYRDHRIKALTELKTEYAALGASQTQTPAKPQF